MKMNRREFFKGVAGAGAGALLSTSCIRSSTRDEFPKTQAESPSNMFSFVHIADQHVRFKRRGDKGYLKCIESIKAIRPKPAFVIMGGDMVFDGNYNPKDEFIQQVKIYKEVSDELGIPYFHCMGNHDVLGLHPRRKVPIDDPDLGKKCIMELLDWDSSYYSFDFGRWHFVILDSIKEITHPDKGPLHTVEIDKEQLEWLSADLGRANGHPTVAVTHIGAFCNIGQINGDSNAKSFDGSMVLNNTKELRLILERHKVKALLQGHSHWIEEYRYNGVWYLTTAAASAAWWAGTWLGSDYGYTVFTCIGDNLIWEHKTFEWETYLEPEDNLERQKIKEQQDFLGEQKRLLKLDILNGQKLTPKPLPKLNVPIK